MKSLVYGSSAARRSVPALICGTVAALALILVGAGQASAGGLTFNFQFDNGGSGEPDGTVTPPIVGTGTFRIATDPGLGTFVLSSLGSYTMSYSFNGYTVTNADIVSNPTLTLVVISSFGPSQERVYFTDSGSGAGGPFDGSLDLQNASEILSFEPASSGGHNLYVDTANSYYGNYLGLTAVPAVPEPASHVQLCLGASCLAGIIWRRRRRTAA
jgi:hypothetical protein